MMEIFSVVAVCFASSFICSVIAFMFGVTAGEGLQKRKSVLKGKAFWAHNKKGEAVFKWKD